MLFRELLACLYCTNVSLDPTIIHQSTKSTHLGWLAHFLSYNFPLIRLVLLDRSQERITLFSGQL